MSRKTWSSDKIFSRLLNNKTTKTYWNNLSELRKRPNQEVFQRAYNLAKSENDEHKIIGLHVLQQLGHSPRFNQEKTIELHFELLEEKQKEKVLECLLHGIGHNKTVFSDKQISKLVEFKDVDNINVKHALISALSGSEDPKAIEVLIELTENHVASIRNWATFSLGSMIEIDNSFISNALWKRVNDSDFDTKSEAIVGLANRKDDKIIEVIFSELRKGDYGTLLLEAIESLGDKSFLPILCEHLAIEKREKGNLKDGWVLKLQDTVDELRKK